MTEKILRLPFRTTCNCWPSEEPWHRVLETIPTKVLIHFKTYLKASNDVDDLIDLLDSELELRKEMNKQSEYAVSEKENGVHYE